MKKNNNLISTVTDNKQRGHFKEGGLICNEWVAINKIAQFIISKLLEDELSATSKTSFHQTNLLQKAFGLSFVFSNRAIKG
ncbi:hypothetical protein J45TS6_47430 [Paenibacillus sp. J45TS6]|uniref:hypothetical protein n=1 Tax=Paenibacillus sp. J45TS6 TaxID=2807196 RepID=UPI001B046D80|nr:hypothetical protein [Paenibacillus sp. J45TS6]GIP46284.1 hypothetical protein J45TS6_47430 [Paenibacillus sp. J45TS6]